MEHELFQSKLKPLVDVTLLPRTIRGSSSGESPHRTAAMGLIFRRSIQERHERVSTKTKNTLRSDPTTQPKSSDVLGTSIPQVQSPIRTLPTPAPAPTPTPVPVPLPSPSSPNPSADSSARPTPPSVKCEAQSDPQSLPACEITGSNDDPIKTTGDDSGTRKVPKYRKKKGRRYKNYFRGPSGEDMVSPADKDMVLPAGGDTLPAVDKDSIPPADVDAVVPQADEDVVPLADEDVNPPSLEATVQLVCRTCNVKQLQSNLQSDLYCSLCFGPAAVMKCVGCGIMRVRDTETCTGCYGRFQ